MASLRDHEGMVGPKPAGQDLAQCEHRGCGGELRGDAEPITPEGYAVWVSCSCGARLEQWVMPADAEADLLRSALLAFEN